MCVPSVLENQAIKMVESKVKECMEELLKFTLESHIEGTQDIDLALPTDFCLLNNPKIGTNSTKGEPPYPLYKQLALALYESINSNAISGTDNWDQSSQLLNTLKSVDFELHVQEPFFTQIKDGLKTVEGRCNVGPYSRIGSGALILFNKCLIVEVKEVRSYGSFSDMLQAESLEKVLPGVKTIEEGVQVYRRFYTEEIERSNGVIAICIEKLPAQPYMYLAKLLSELGNDGIQSLLELNSHEFSA
ncbi:putative PUA-like domain-containing protein [Rosa chinensis]|uniref:Putative PUA-like domain-containing protein n=1 Tax=Rosa chinensis TaxID=74649 RepID=A0A2P6PWF0_ROSCH|nr:uncharacterized protein LOC112172428 [Rosa chinensis]PRQ26261.1 putative PUA-like domain-containing protein [Rosa chinensis]